MKENRSPGRRIATQAGFTLVEVMMAAAVASIIGLGIAQMLTDMSWRQRMVVQMMNYSDLRLVTYNALRTKDGCTKTLAGLQIKNGKASAVNVPGGIKDSAGTVHVTTTAGQPGNEFGKDAAKLVITGISFWGSSAPVAHVPQNATVGVKYQKTIATGTDEMTHEITITVVPDPSLKVEYCFGEDALASEICKYYNGTLNSTTGLCDTFEVPTGHINNATLDLIKGDTTVERDMTINRNLNVNSLATLQRASILNGLTTNRLIAPPNQNLTITTGNPNTGICMNGACQTSFGNVRRKCPSTPGGKDVYVVGMDRGGNVLCGARSAE